MHLPNFSLIILVFFIASRHIHLIKNINISYAYTLLEDTTPITKLVYFVEETINHQTVNRLIDSELSMCANCSYVYLK